MQHRQLSFLALAGGLLMVACADVPTDTAPVTGPDAGPAPQAMLIGMDGAYARIADEVPGFGGAYLDENQRLVVHMANRQLDTEGDQIRSELRGRLPTRHRSPEGLAMDARPEMVLRNGAYDYRQLVEYKGKAGAVFGLPGAVFTDIDETANRIRIGIEAGASEARFLETLEAAGVPRRAVTFTRTEPIVALKGETLHDRVQPIGGGAQLVFPHPVPGYIFLCTLGFNVQMEGRGRSESYFVTNSHCTSDQGEVDGTPYYQQGLALPNEDYLIAHEIMDPEYWDCGGGFICRWADAAVAKYETRRTPVNFGGIHRPDEMNTGSVAIEEEEPNTFTIVDEAPWPQLGDMLSKVGRTTGWTHGPVVGTCINTLQSGTNRGILCQDWVGAGVGGGDSGSPVFMQHGDSKNATLYGVLWGGGGGAYVFSAMENIRIDLGDFDTH